MPVRDQFGALCLFTPYTSAKWKRFPLIKIVRKGMFLPLASMIISFYYNLLINFLCTDASRWLMYKPPICGNEDLLIIWSAKFSEMWFGWNAKPESRQISTVSCLKSVWKEGEWMRGSRKKFVLLCRKTR